MNDFLNFIFATGAKSLWGNISSKISQHSNLIFDQCRDPLGNIRSLVSEKMLEKLPAVCKFADNGCQVDTRMHEHHDNWWTPWWCRYDTVILCCFLSDIAMVWGECWWLFPLQVEMLRSQLGDHEQSCAFRLVNCVDLACQQRIPVSRCSIVRVATKTKTWTGNTIIESGCWPTWTTTTRLRTSLGLREAPTAATSLWMRSDNHNDHSGNNDNVYKCMKWVLLYNFQEDFTKSIMWISDQLHYDEK